ncbi:MAG TPA: sensor domain-containing diguanylate cyclase [Candidatus Dormibacteraeota bacterium]
MPDPTSPARRWGRFTAWAGLFGLCSVAFVVWMAVTLGGTTVTTAVDDIGEAVAAGIAAVSCGFAAIRTQGKLRRAWTLLAASSASWFLGQAFWSVYEVGLGRTVPSPSVADIGFLVAIPLALAGILSFATSARGTSIGLRLWLDRAIVLMSLLFLAWELGLGDILTVPGAPLSARLVGAAYPVGDILIATVLLLAIRRATDEQKGRLLLLLGGLAANALADSAFAYLSLTGTTKVVLDAGWVVGYLMIALAALWPSGVRDTTSEEQPIDIWQLVLPWLPILAGGLTAIVLAVHRQSMDAFATSLAGLVIGLLMASQVIAHRESLRLLIQSRLSAETLNAVIEHAPLGVVRIATDMTIIDANPSFYSIVGSVPGTLIGGTVARFLPEGEIRPAVERLNALLDEATESADMETEGTRADGTTIWLHWTATAVWNKSGEVDYFLVMFEDVSERRSTEDALKAAYAELEDLVGRRTAELRSANEKLNAAVITDPLTGLYNRRHLSDFIERELSRTRRAGHKIVFALIDLDHFKRVNDTFGHEAGDAVLCALSTFLRNHIRQEDLAFRYGGEEFLLVMPSAGLDGVAKRIEQIRELVTLVKVVHGTDPIWPLTLSIGVAIYPDHGDTADAVIGNADEALYRAKQAGRNQVVYHEAEVLVPVEGLKTPRF